jgi:thiol-disulfide isomerase/thioredoxin
VLVNLWASWCGPCIKELPTLAKLSDAHLEDGQLGVIAVCQDRGPQSSVTAFLAAHKIDGLGAYQDPEMALSGALGVQVMPTTVLYDRQGREMWRYVGDMDWTSAEASKLLAEAGAG